MKTLSKRVKYKNKRKGLFNSGLIKLLAVALTVGSAVLIVTTEKDCAEKEQELITVQAKIDSYEAENMELQRVLDSDDMSAYM